MPTNRLIVAVNAAIALAFANYIKDKAKQPSQTVDPNTQQIIDDSARRRAEIEARLNKSQGANEKSQGQDSDKTSQGPEHQ